MSAVQSGDQGRDTSRMSLDDLRQEQSRLLSQVSGRLGSRAGPKSLPLPADLSDPTMQLQARTGALQAELDFHKDLLDQLTTPSSSRDPARATGGAKVPEQLDRDGIKKNGSVPSSMRRGTFWGTYTPEEARGKHMGYGDTQPQKEHAIQDVWRQKENTGGGVGDAYGSLLKELQAVKQQVSRFVESAHLSPLTMKMQDVAQQHYGERNRDPTVLPSHTDSLPLRTPSFRSDEMLAARKSARSARANAMREYRQRMLEEREAIIDDLESRISKAAMRSCRDVLRQSHPTPREIDRLYHTGKQARRRKQKQIAEECFAEVHESLRTMRREVEQEKVEAERKLRKIFAEDKNDMLETMRLACEKEREEHIRRLTDELEGDKRAAMEHHKQLMDVSCQYGLGSNLFVLHLSDPII